MKPGDRVQLTGRFLQSTGQVAGGEGQSVWTVVACPRSMCASGRFVAVNEPSENDPSRPRHMAEANLKIAHKPSVRDCV
jgi:hypothetical protein